MRWLLPCLCLMLVWPVSSDARVLRLHTGTIDPAATPDAARRASGNLPSAPLSGYFYLQFDGPVHEAHKAAVRELGVALYDYVPDFAFVARFDAVNATALARLESVRAWLDFAPRHALAPGVFQGESPLTVRFFPDVTAAKASARLRAAGFEPLRMSGSIAMVETQVARLPELAAISGVRWVEPRGKAEQHNDKSTAIVGAQTARRDLGYYGQGQVVSLLDQNMAGGVIADAHVDFGDGRGSTRIKALVPVPGLPNCDQMSGNDHGIHTAGTLLGNGLASGADPARDLFPDDCKAGVAPKADLVFQCIGTIKGTMDAALFPKVFDQAHALGARVSSNSWSFSSIAHQILADTAASRHKDLLLVFAAGNSALDANADGIVDLRHISGEPAAKNVLTVGASESRRPENATTWLKDVDYGGVSRWPAEPVRSDLVANATNGMAAFSSRGPTEDGRTKPDIGAPGSLIHSTVGKTGYRPMSGTSMSTPAVAGAAALVREYLAREQGIAAPSAALVKAALINGARSMGPGQYGTGRYREIPAQTPNNVNGFGLLNLEETLSPQAPFAIDYYDVDDANGLSTGDTRQFHCNVVHPGQPLKAHLVWTDAPGIEQALGALVNDLDLSLVSPSGRVHYPGNARLPYETTPFLAPAARGDNFILEKGKMLIQELPALPADAMGLGPIDVPLAAPLAAGASAHLMAFQLAGNGTLLNWSGSGAHVFAAGTTRLTFPRPSLKRMDPERSVALGLKCDTADLALKASGPPLDTGRRFLRFMEIVWTNGTVHAVQKTDPTDLPAFAAEVDALADNASPNFDRVNNALGIRIENPETGQWTIRVHGHNVPQGPQGFALVTSGVSGAVDHGPAPIAQKPARVPLAAVVGATSRTPAQNELATRYNLPGRTALGEVREAELSIAPLPTQDALAAFCYLADGLDANTASALALVKLRDDDTTAEFAYSREGEFADGNWWLSDLADNIVAPGDTLDPHGLYRVNLVVADNGPFDLDPRVNLVRDPTVITVNATESGASASGGCALAGRTSPPAAAAAWLALALLAGIAAAASRLRRRA